MYLAAAAVDEVAQGNTSINLLNNKDYKDQKSYLLNNLVFFPIFSG